MRHLNCSYKIRPKKISDLFNSTLQIQDNLSELDILEVQDRFLTNGFSPIKVRNVRSGRRLIDMFLNVLPVYQDIGSLTLSQEILKTNIINIYQELKLGGYLQQHGQSFIDDFFSEQFCCDFIWIEATNNLLTTNWFEKFIHEIVECKIERNIPILIFSYQE